MMSTRDPGVVHATPAELEVHQEGDNRREFTLERHEHQIVHQLIVDLERVLYFVRRVGYHARVVGSVLIEGVFEFSDAFEVLFEAQPIPGAHLSGQRIGFAEAVVQDTALLRSPLLRFLFRTVACGWEQFVEHLVADSEAWAWAGPHLATTCD